VRVRVTGPAAGERPLLLDRTSKARAQDAPRASGAATESAPEEALSAKGEAASAAPSTAEKVSAGESAGATFGSAVSVVTTAPSGSVEGSSRASAPPAAAPVQVGGPTESARAQRLAARFALAIANGEADDRVLPLSEDDPVAEEYVVDDADDDALKLCFYDATADCDDICDKLADGKGTPLGVRDDEGEDVGWTENAGSEPVLFPTASIRADEMTQLPGLDAHGQFVHVHPVPRFRIQWVPVFAAKSMVPTIIATAQVGVVTQVAWHVARETPGDVKNEISAP
jgi:hypothetical protein